MVPDFVYDEPVRVYFGAGRLASLSAVLADLGLRTCVIVCGPHFEAQARALAASCPEVKGIWAGVEPNPQLSGVCESARLARERGAEAVVGVGGGSAIDTAKFAAAAALGDLTPADYYGGAAFPRQRLAVVAVPTTAGTGSEVTQVSVVNDGAQKKTINDPAFMPRAAIVDPELMLSVPPRTTMITGLDALAHALEGFWSRSHQPIADLTAAEAVRLILGSLERAWANGADREARGAMAYAATLAGMSFARPRTAGCHACSYPLSMDWHLPHGEACAFTLGAFVRINADERLEGLCRAAGLSGGTEELSAEIERLKALAGLRTRLSQLGDVDVGKLAADCAAHPLMRNNPVPMTPEALAEMFRALA